MFGRFWKDRRGGYAIATSVLAVPLIGALAVAVDYSEMSRQRQTMLNALDAAGIATARRVTEGASDDQAKAYAFDFFKSNLGSISTSNASLTVTLPQNNATAPTLKLCATHTYTPYFYPAFVALIGGGTVNTFPYAACSEVRLKNTIEVALALDNSGSMDYIGTGSGKKRIDLLKSAAKDLVTTLAAQAGSMKQVAEPVRFAVVPFAASVDVGSSYKSASWMDTTGISPVHHENFNWAALSQANNANRYAELVGGVWYARGNLWGTFKDKPLTRFTVFDTMQRIKAILSANNQTACTTAGGAWNAGAGKCFQLDSVASWAGCVEARPYPYNVNDDAPSSSTPATLFVPMFAPDETDRTDGSSRPANNNWWPDLTSVTTTVNSVGPDLARLRHMPKYWDYGTTVRSAYGDDAGPNISCSTTAVTPLTDVGASAGLDKIKAAIDAMVPNGATNVIEGLAWGWRVVSSKAPFTEGRSEAERGNDKVVIVLTDGANTYYDPTSITAEQYSGTYWNYGGNDLAATESTYSAYGYAGFPYNGGSKSRIFLGTSSAVSSTTYTNANFTKAMNEHFATLCANAKAGNVILMTVSLDLNSSNTTEKTQMDALKSCASESRFRKNGDGTAAKLYWNANGGSLADVFKQIGDELSNMRIVS